MKKFLFISITMAKQPLPLTKIELGLASPDRIRQWTQRMLPDGKIVGEVTHPGTLNHKTFQPEANGLFCERIFGPLRDFQCACGNRVRTVPNGKRLYCKVCEVEFTWAIMRRYRMGCISLSAPVTHPWYVKSSPCWLGIFLDLKPSMVQGIVYGGPFLTLEKVVKNQYTPMELPSASELWSAWKESIKTPNFGSDAGPVPSVAGVADFVVPQSATLLSPMTQKTKGSYKVNNDQVSQAVSRKPARPHTIVPIPLDQWREENGHPDYIASRLQKSWPKRWLFEGSRRLWQTIHKQAHVSIYKNLKQQHDLRKQQMIAGTKLESRKIQELDRFEQRLKSIAKIQWKSDSRRVWIRPKIFTANRYASVYVQKYAPGPLYRKTTKQERRFVDLSPMSRSKRQRLWGPMTQKTLGSSLPSGAGLTWLSPSMKRYKRLVGMQKLSLSRFERLYAKQFLRGSRWFMQSPVFFKFTGKWKKRNFQMNKNKFGNLLKSEALFRKVKKLQFIFRTVFKEQTLEKLKNKLLQKRFNVEIALQKNPKNTALQIQRQQLLETWNKVTFFRTKVTKTNAFIAEKSALPSGTSAYEEKYKGFRSIGDAEMVGGKLGSREKMLSKSKRMLLAEQLMQAIYDQQSMDVCLNLARSLCLGLSFGAKDNVSVQKCIRWVLQKTANFQEYGKSYPTFYMSSEQTVFGKMTKLTNEWKPVFHPLTNELTEVLQKTRESLCFWGETSQESLGEPLGSLRSSFPRNVWTDSLFLGLRFTQRKLYEDAFTTDLGSRLITENANSSAAFTQTSHPARLLRSSSLWDDRLGKSGRASTEKVRGICAPLYSVSHREFWWNEEDWWNFSSYMVALPDPTDQVIPIYAKMFPQMKTLDPLTLPLGAGILQKMLEEFSPEELQKQDLQNRLLFQRCSKDLITAKYWVLTWRLQPDPKGKDRRGKYPKYGRRTISRLRRAREGLLRRTKLIRKMVFMQSMPKNMLLSVLPVLPPDLRPIVQMGDQINASDLNRLYQRVLSRNQVLSDFLGDLNIGDSFETRYAQRMLQEAVDNLIENGKGRVLPECDANGRPLKSLADVLKGKQGRFRQHLLGKRVDYSGRSVIVVGPQLRMHECGIPREMAIELFLPFLLRSILEQKLTLTVMGAKEFIRKYPDKVNQLLQNIMRSHPVVLNRAPTLHRLGFQAFQPRLVHGRAILLHPLVCPPFNADFDGDQMAVHVPITTEARAEAWKLMFTRNNLMSPATGDPVILPSQDMVLGCYYLTTDPRRFQKGTGRIFASVAEVLQALEQRQIDLHALIWLRWFGPVKQQREASFPLEMRIHRSGQTHVIFGQSQYQMIHSPSEGATHMQLQRQHRMICTTPGRVLFHSVTYMATSPYPRSDPFLFGSSLRTPPSPLRDSKGL